WQTAQRRTRRGALRTRGRIPAIFGSLHASRCGASADGGRRRVRGAGVDGPLDSGTALRQGTEPLNERPNAPPSCQA
ncbi:hypothetical protein T484DRAFT_1922927, partial [Baffinella frigidus]